MLCCGGLDRRSLWLDEGASWAIASQHGAALFHAIARDGGNLALYYLLLHLLIEIGGSAAWWLRLPSALAAAACVPVTYSLGLALGGRRLACYGAALCAVSVALVYWGQMARGYTLAALLAVTSLRLLVAVLGGAGRLALAGWVVVSVALVATELIALGVVAVGGALALWPARPGPGRRALLWATPIVALLAAPFCWLALRRGHTQLFWLPEPGSKALRATAVFLAGGWYTPKGSLVESCCVATLLAAGGFLALTAGRALALRRAPEAFAALLLLLVGFGLPLALFVVSRLGPALFIDRYFSPCLPETALAVAYPLARLPGRLLAPLALGALLALRASALPSADAHVVDDWRSASAYLLAEAQPGDCLAFFANDGYVDFTYYERHPPVGVHPVAGLHAVLPELRAGALPALVEEYATLTPSQVRALPTRCPATFLVLSHDGSRIGTTRSRQLFATGLALHGALARAYSSQLMRHFPAVTVYLFRERPGAASTGARR